MTRRERTESLVLAVVAIVSVYTFAMSTNGVTGDTVSEVQSSWWGRWWVIPLAWGALAGHFRGPTLPASIWNNGLTLAALGSAGLVLGTLRVPSPVAALGWRGDGLLLAAGYPLGAYLWPLHRKE